MRFSPSAACAVLALGAFFPATASAQSADAFVLPFGMFRVGIEGSHATHESLFDASGSRVRIGDELSGDLTPDRFIAIQPLATALAEFLDATSDSPGATPDAADPAAISLGQLDLAAAASRTEARARISVGILPRLEIGASMPLGRGERLVQRFALAGGNLGVNPDRPGNSELLASIGWAPLGDAALLPTADSPLGTELQNRVTSLTGQALTLPSNAADSEMLQSLITQGYGLGAIASRVEPWRAGDLEVEARGLLLSTFGNAPVPMELGGVHLRVAVSGGARLPTGEEPDSLHFLSPRPTERLSALHAGGAGDLFVGSRFWVTGAVRLAWGRETEVTRRIAPADAPFSVDAGPTVVRISPGSGMEIRIAPRFRLDQAIALGAEYTLLSVGDTQYSGGGDGVDAGVLNISGGSAQRVGFGIRYSSLPAYWLGQAALPAEVTLGYHRIVSGPEGAVAGGVVTVTASILPRIW